MRPDRWTLSALALLASLSVAAAQQPQSQPPANVLQNDKAKPAASRH